MKSASATAPLVLLFGLLPGLALATGTRPLRLELPALSSTSPATTPSRQSAFARTMAPRPERSEALFRRNGARAARNRPEVETRARSLGRQALENVLDPEAMPLESERAEGSLQLKFQKRGNAIKDLNRGYREMCDRVSAKIWDDPNGKRIRFDVAGKPGVGIEIPVGHH